MSESDFLTFCARARPHRRSARRQGRDRSQRREQLRPQGTLDFVDNALDRSSGTIHARATVPNPDLFLAPGQFARLRVAIAPPAPVLLLPDAAVVLDQSQHLVMTVAARRHRVPKIVTTGDLRGGLRVILSGLEPTDRVIIDGLVRAIPGAKVAPQDGTIHYDATADGQRLGDAQPNTRSMQEIHDTQLHRPADLRHRAQRLRDADRARRARHPAGRAISGDRAADGPDHHASIPAPPPRRCREPWRRRSSRRSTASRTCST